MPNHALPIIAAEYNSTMDAVAWSMRSLICAAPGHRLLAADFANIEGRTIAYLAGEEWKLEAFRDYDTILGHDEKGKAIRKGPDLYLVSAGKVLGIPADKVTKPQRQAIGKPSELGLGFGGGPGAYLTMMKNGAVMPWLKRDGEPPKPVTLDDVANAVRSAVAPSVWADAAAQYSRGALESATEKLEEMRINLELAEHEREGIADTTAKGQKLPDVYELAAAIAKKNRQGLSPDHWTALRVSVDLWRQSNFMIARLWSQLENAAIEAIERPGSVVPAGDHIKFCLASGFLRMRLPSGRTLSYAYPRVERDGNRVRIKYFGVDSYTKQWKELDTYGGKLAENATQAGARDGLRDAILRLRKKGYRVVLHVHDEIVCEMPIGQGSLEEMCAIMREQPKWAPGLPIAVEGWAGKRYRK